MSAYEQRIEPPDRSWQYLLFAAEPYETISFKVLLGVLYVRPGMLKSIMSTQITPSWIFIDILIISFCELYRILHEILHASNKIFV